jgi:hypothetical protein
MSYPSMRSTNIELLFIVYVQHKSGAVTENHIQDLIDIARSCHIYHFQRSSYVHVLVSMLWLFDHRLVHRFAKKNLDAAAENSRVVSIAKKSPSNKGAKPKSATTTPTTTTTTTTTPTAADMKRQVELIEDSQKWLQLSSQILLSAHEFHHIAIIQPQLSMYMKRVVMPIWPYVHNVCHSFTPSLYRVHFYYQCNSSVVHVWMTGTGIWYM